MHCQTPKSSQVQTREREVVDETTPLVVEGSSYNACTDAQSSIERGPENVIPDTDEKQSVAGVLWVLFIGVFISQVDTSLALATYGTIASEFDDLQNASWLVSVYMLAMCVGQPLYGKLSDTFGRKTMVQIAYGLFALGSGLCGWCQSMPQLIAARALQGIGGGGMITLVAILITDLVPLRQVATWRSYVNVVQTVGRSSGGAIGGLLSQAFGWRWTLSGQAPSVIIGMILVWWKLEVPKRAWDNDADEPITAKLKRVDFFGALFLSGAIICLLLILDLGGERLPWTSPTILLLCGVGIKNVISFVLVEKKWAKEPIFPLHLLTKYDVVTSYFIISLQNASQTALIFLVPLYFEVTYNASPGQAGAYMIPAIVGNTLGGLVTGFYLKHYGRTKTPIILSTIFSGICYALLIVLWNGHGSPGWMSLLIFPGGFAVGVAHSALFVALAAGVGEENMAIAGSGQYLCGTVGSVAGVCAANAVFQANLKSALYRAFRYKGIPNSEKIIRKSLSDVTYVQKLSGHIRDLVVGSYISGFHGAFLLCLGLAALCFVVSLVTSNRILPTHR